MKHLYPLSSYKNTIFIMQVSVLGIVNLLSFVIHYPLSYIALPGIIASTTPITSAPINAPIIEILNPVTMNFVT